MSLSSASVSSVAAALAAVLPSGFKQSTELLLSNVRPGASESDHDVDKEMSEEKPTFKITDRRLFNPDGTPREHIREEEPPQTESSITPPPPEQAAESVTAEAAHAATAESPRVESGEPSASRRAEREREAPPPEAA